MLDYWQPAISRVIYAGEFRVGQRTRQHADREFGAQRLGRASTVSHGAFGRMPNEKKNAQKITTRSGILSLYTATLFFQ